MAEGDKGTLYLFLLIILLVATCKAGNLAHEYIQLQKAYNDCTNGGAHVR